MLVVGLVPGTGLFVKRSVLSAGPWASALARGLGVVSRVLSNTKGNRDCCSLCVVTCRFCLCVCGHM